MKNSKSLNSIVSFLVFVFFININLLAQNNLDYYLNKAFTNSPSLNEIKNLKRINNLEYERNIAESSSLKSDITANYLFAPYFNNNGNIISVNPDKNAIGYDVGITNGGLYSAQLNFTKNIFNGGITSGLNTKKTIEQERSDFNLSLEKKNITKQITDQYLTAYKSLKIYDLSKGLVDNLVNQLKLTENLVEQGYVKSTDYLLLKIELKNQRITENENFQQFRSDLLQLNSLCGIRDTNVVYIDSVSLNISNTKTNFSFIEQYNLDSLNTVNQQYLFETKYDPKVELFFNTGLNAVELNGIQRKFGLSAGINFQIPILDGGQKNITRQQNQISLNSISEYKSYAQLNIANQKRMSLTKINDMRNNLKATISQIDDYKKLISISLSELKNGDITMIEYLTILKNYIDLRKTKIEKEINILVEINNFNYWNE